MASPDPGKLKRLKMVDRATARMLVWGTLATLLLVLVIAVYAFNQKKVLSKTLDR